MFCEECGAELSPGARFCENCGTPVPVENFSGMENKNQDYAAEDSDWKSMFASGGWKSGWEKVQGEKGIILTKPKVLCAQLGCSKEDLEDIFQDYAAFSAGRGIFYYLLDLDENRVSPTAGRDVRNVLSALEKIFECNPPKYLFIIGNEDVVGFQTWKNESGDSDADVSSDFAYTALNPGSPWSGAKYNFDNALRVGRLPTWSGESLGQFKRYFENAKKGIGKIKKLNSFGLSALVWKNESNDSFLKISSGKVEVSPAVTKLNVDGKIAPETNLFLFNLHGSADTEFWYGQDGTKYPEAFSPENMRSIKSLNFIGVEACYGAMYEGGKNSGCSNVLAALIGRTIALLGSSRIAYGTSNPPGSCADIVVGEFLKQIAAGETAGDAHIFALKKLCSKEMDDSDIKTLCEFALYGDPAASIGKIKAHSASKSFSVFSKISAERKSASGLHIAVPDVRSAVRLELSKVDAKIAEAVNAHVYKNYPELDGAEPKIYSFGKPNLFQSIYQNEKNQIVKIYFDSFGCIKKELSSK